MMSGNLEPLTGDIVERHDEAANRQVAAMTAAFDSIYIPYPRHTLIHSQCDYLQKLGVLTKGRPQKGLRVLALSGSGKTTAAKAYMQLAQGRAARDVIPVVYVQLTKFVTPRWLMTAILDFFGDPFGSKGTEATLRQRAQACFERFGSELLIIDEVQHLNFRSTQANDITDYLKILLDSGTIPIVFMGTEEARAMFQRNVQLNGRLLPPCDIEPLNATSTEDHELLLGYVSALCREMAKPGLLRAADAFTDSWTLSCLHEVSSGVIGRVSRLVRVAVEIAIRRGATEVELYDLSLAVDRWAKPHAFVAFNPFRAGEA